MIEQSEFANRISRAGLRQLAGRPVARNDALRVIRHGGRVARKAVRFQLLFVFASLRSNPSPSGLRDDTPRTHDPVKCLNAFYAARRSCLRSRRNYASYAPALNEASPWAVQTVLAFAALP